MRAFRQMSRMGLVTLAATGIIAGAVSAKTVNNPPGTLYLPGIVIDAPANNGTVHMVAIMAPSGIDTYGHANFLVLGPPADDLLKMGKRLGALIDGDDNMVLKAPGGDQFNPDQRLGMQTDSDVLVFDFNDTGQRTFLPDIVGEIATAEAPDVRRDILLGTTAIITSMKATGAGIQTDLGLTFAKALKTAVPSSTQYAAVSDTDNGFVGFKTAGIIDTPAPLENCLGDGGSACLTFAMKIWLRDDGGLLTAHRLGGSSNTGPGSRLNV